MQNKQTKTLPKNPLGDICNDLCRLEAPVNDKATENREAARAWTWHYQRGSGPEGIPSHTGTPSTSIPTATLPETPFPG